MSETTLTAKGPRETASGFRADAHLSPANPGYGCGDRRARSSARAPRRMSGML